MIRKSDLRRFTTRYPRNGVADEGFNLCRFAWGRGKNAVDLQAIVFSAPGRVAVTSSAITDRWRGDDFEEAIRAHLADSETDPATYSYEATT